MFRGSETASLLEKVQLEGGCQTRKAYSQCLPLTFNNPSRDLGPIGADRHCLAELQAQSRISPSRRCHYRTATHGTQKV
jgi:hypothetical protein